MSNENNRVYLDHAAGTPVLPEVLEVMLPYFSDQFGNPGGVYKEGQEAREAVSNARKRVAEILHSRVGEVIFTSGCTEANNLAIRGVVNTFKSKHPDQTPHIITTSFEHKSVLEPIRELEEGGVEVTYLNPNEEGLISVSDLRDAITEETVLIAIMYINNEIGTIQPIKELARAAKVYRHKGEGDYIEYPYFFTDAAQAPGVVSIAMDSLGVDLATFSGQKFYGPKGAGILYANQRVNYHPEITGGKQELGKRAGTENVAQIVGQAKALELAVNGQESEVERLSELRDYLIDELGSLGLTLNGSREQRVAGNVNVSLPTDLNLSAEQMVIELDAKGFATATGSACDSGEYTGSHVILAIGKSDEESRRAIRITLGKSSDKESIKNLVADFKDILERYQSIREINQ